MAPQRAAALSLLTLVLVTLASPLALRAVNRIRSTAGDRPSFVPSFELPRTRLAFDETHAAVIREANPEFVIIGDSTAGSRIQPGHLSRQVSRGVIGLFVPGTPVPQWYLTLKNFLVDNQVPALRGAVIFFRDDQLTSQVEVNTQLLDTAARDYEPELDRVLAARRLGAFAAIHAMARRTYESDRTRAWLEPTLLNGPAGVAGGGEAPRVLIDRINSEVFGLDRLRKFAAADLTAGAGAALDFDANVNRSLLPEFLALADRAGIRLAFIRVQRRPRPDGPPPQSQALRRYVERLEDYIEERGYYFGDDWGDPDETLSTYVDGDHLAPEASGPYTERFARKHASFFR